MTFDSEQGWMLLLFLAAAFALAGCASRLGNRGHDTEIWIASLRKPQGFPPPWVFAPVWVLTTLCAGIAGWWLWLGWWQGMEPFPLILYGLGLGLQAGWQAVSLGYRNLDQGEVWGLLAWVAIALAAIAGFRAPGFAWLWLMPYWLWLLFNWHLHRQLQRLNRPPNGYAG